MNITIKKIKPVALGLLVAYLFFLGIHYTATLSMRMSLPFEYTDKQRQYPRSSMEFSNIQQLIKNRVDAVYLEVNRGRRPPTKTEQLQRHNRNRKHFIVILLLSLLAFAASLFWSYSIVVCAGILLGGFLYTYWAFINTFHGSLDVLTFSSMERLMDNLFGVGLLLFLLLLFSLAGIILYTRKKSGKVKLETKHLPSRLAKIVATAVLIFYIPLLTMNAFVFFLPTGKLSSPGMLEKYISMKKHILTMNKLGKEVGEELQAQTTQLETQIKQEAGAIRARQKKIAPIYLVLALLFGLGFFLLGLLLLGPFPGCALMFSSVLLLHVVNEVYFTSPLIMDLLIKSAVYLTFFAACFFSWQKIFGKK